jgi:hypothetical protein
LFITIHKAATGANKSTRTLKRYLEKLDNLDKSKVSNSKLYVHFSFVKMAKDGHFLKGKNTPLPIKESPTIDKQTKQTKIIESLESRNKELFDIIREKDAPLQQKDELILFFNFDTVH